MARLLGMHRLWTWDHTWRLPQDRDCLQSQRHNTKKSHWEYLPTPGLRCVAPSLPPPQASPDIPGVILLQLLLQSSLVAVFSHPLFPALAHSGLSSGPLCPLIGRPTSFIQYGFNPRPHPGCIVAITLYLPGGHTVLHTENVCDLWCSLLMSSSCGLQSAYQSVVSKQSLSLSLASSDQTPTDFLCGEF